MAVEETIRWDNVTTWINDIVSGQLDRVDRCFIDHRLSAPTVIWNPHEKSLPAEPLKILLAYWRSLIGRHSIPLYRDIRPEQIIAALGYVNILEAQDGSLDLKYRLFGSRVADVSGFDMTGKLLSEHPSSQYVREFSLATTNASMIRKEPLFTVREPAGAEKVYRWPRLILPLAGLEGRAERGIVATVPLNGDGRLVV